LGRLNSWSEMRLDFDDIVTRVLDLKQEILEFTTESSTLTGSVAWEDLLRAIDGKLHEFGRDPQSFPYANMSVRCG
jgi:hypothetical protein